ncbi:hypothetical protein F511_43374 [Dorcoceras hygrometricum]|uniref:Uncharacterized protein n=1 Tax=Dorcoceras hygrometricum TaxID=472368 RepID=A0A2Z7CZY4_9LAMI|nr:hypothetical protein F511_43374 [Dorcoceras hygrometricum]
MTSVVMSSQSADEESSAGALSVDDINSDVIIQQEATVISRKLSAYEKRTFCPCAKDSADALYVDNQSQDTSRELQGIQSQDFHDQQLDNQLQTYRYNQLDIQTQAIFIQSRATGDPVKGYSALHIQSPKNSAEAQSSSRHESAVKQLTIYESWMSNAERNSNGENDKTQSTLKMERING